MCKESSENVGLEFRHLSGTKVALLLDFFNISLLHIGNRYFDCVLEVQQSTSHYFFITSAWLGGCSTWNIASFALH